ncbi:MAG TPA: hypothetical protein VGC91_16160 [Pyrinomonadaceae bacterium]
MRSLDNGFTSVHRGAPPDIPVPGDFAMRDGLIDLTVRRDSNNNFYSISEPNTGFPVLWSLSGDVPVSTPYRIE